MEDDAIQEALLGMRELYRRAGARSGGSIFRAFVLGNVVRRLEGFGNGFPRFYRGHVKGMIPHVLHLWHLDPRDPALFCACHHDHMVRSLASAAASLANQWQVVLACVAKASRSRRHVPAHRTVLCHAERMRRSKAKRLHCRKDAVTISWARVGHCAQGNVAAAMNLLSQAGRKFEEQTEHEVLPHVRCTHRTLSFDLLRCL